MAEQASAQLDPRQLTFARADAADLAARLPDLLMDSRVIANTVAHGLHGRKRPGPGETFWQFRRFQLGEPAKRIDWRRSARDETLYVREKEWEAAQTIWIYIDRSASMFYGSHLSMQPKIDRAVLLALATADLLVRSGERVGLIGLVEPTAQRNAAERFAEALLQDINSNPKPDAGGLPEPGRMKRFSQMVVFSDLLDPVVAIEAQAAKLAGAGIAGHFVAISDPVEETFPFGGRIEFTDPETRMRLVLGRAESIREDYAARIADRNRRLRLLSDRLAWSLLPTHTDRPAVEALLALHRRLSEGA